MLFEDCNICFCIDHFGDCINFDLGCFDINFVLDMKLLFYLNYFDIDMDLYFFDLVYFLYYLLIMNFVFEFGF